MTGDGKRHLGSRMLRRHETLTHGGVALTITAENISKPTEWCLDERRHTFVLHLAGELQSLESTFSHGPSGRVLPLPDDFWVIPAGCRYSALAKGREVSFAELSVPTALLGDRELCASVRERDPLLSALLRRIESVAARDDDVASMLLRSALECVRVHVQDKYGHAHRARLSNQALSPKDMQRVSDFIAKALGHPISVNLLARQIGMQENTFSRVFLRAFGCTPWSFVQQRRIEQAKVMLKQDRHSITEIALAVGFATPSHFATSFKRAVGVTPSRYRVHSTH